MRVSFEIPDIPVIPAIPLKKLLVAMVACSPILAVTVAIANNLIAPGVCSRAAGKCRWRNKSCCCRPATPASHCGCAARAGLSAPLSAPSVPPMRPSSPAGRAHRLGSGNSRQCCA